MCRLLLANCSGITALTQVLASFPNCPDLARYLKRLELKDGGHGNSLEDVRGLEEHYGWVDGQEVEGGI